MSPNNCLAPCNYLCNNNQRSAKVNAQDYTFFIRDMGRMLSTSSFRHWGAVLPCLLFAIIPASAQNIITPPPQTRALPSAVQERQDSNPMQVFASQETAPTMPLQLGPVIMHPHLDYQLLYGSGIESSPGQRQNSVIQQFSPGVLFNLGDHWTLDYTPTLYFYSSSNLRNNVNESAQLGWGTAYNDWFFSGSQSYGSSSSPNAETAAQTDQEIYSTMFNASYQFNDKMSLDMGFNQIFNYVGSGGSSTNLLQNLTNSRGWSTMDWLNYEFWSRFNAGLGFGFGYNQQDGSPDSIYEQYQARVNWRATDKISFQLGGGLQDQQYLGGGASALLTPILNAIIQYQPFEQTKLSVSAGRAVNPSLFQNQVTENTQIMGDLNQRLLGRLYLDLSGGYSTTKYLSSAGSSSAASSAGRKDDYYIFNARLNYIVLKRATVSIFYGYSDNASHQSGFATSGSGFAYTSRQVGFEIGYRY